jgi:HK97 family phage prohead protease
VEYNGDRVRTVADSGFAVRDDAKDGEMPTLVGRFATFNEWAEIDSAMEGHFLERMSPGAFTKTIAENREHVRVLFHHGLDPNIGMKVLGPVTRMEESAEGVEYEVPLLDTDYNRQLLPGLRAGLYGSSYKFKPVKYDPNLSPQRSDHNPDAIPEVSVTELKLKEFGPTPFPSYKGATASIRSATDEILFTGLIRQPEKLRELLRAEGAAALPAEPGAQESPAAPTPGSRSTQSPRFKTREEFLAWISGT